MTNDHLLFFGILLDCILYNQSTARKMDYIKFDYNFC